MSYRLINRLSTPLLGGGYTVGFQGGGGGGTIGPTGPQGIQGPVGPVGPAGAQGPVGPAGAQGIQGIQGPAGADGVDGAQGPAGPAGPQGPAGPGMLYYFNNNRSFGGATLTGATSGHTIVITLNKNTGEVCRCDVSISRLGGVHMNMPYTGTTGVNSQVIATLPVGYRPSTTIVSVGNSSNDNFWATSCLNWGSFQLGTSGQIVQRCNAQEPITNLQPNFEQISGTLYFMANGGSVYTGDGIV